jgi:hypothetical protein
MTKVNKTNLFVKANFNALAGLPISFALNLAILPFFAPFFADPQGAYIGASLVAIPFYLTSVFRQYIIDFTYEKYGININPSCLMKKLIGRACKK